MSLKVRKTCKTCSALCKNNKVMGDRRDISVTIFPQINLID